mmetsp:Transcript_31086/g.82361  ORF Transcript_31086/g.82361 Transcript_31086/m.82361 type:complete len:291 (-) Transcript_31086:30-902(-)
MGAGASELCLTEEQQARKFSGRWINAKGNLNVIGTNAVQWSDGTATVLQYESWGGRHYCSTELNEKDYTAHLTSDGRLQWSDGDSWSRESSDKLTPTAAVLHAGYSIFTAPLRGLSADPEERCVEEVGPDAKGGEAPAKVAESRSPAQYQPGFLGGCTPSRPSSEAQSGAQVAREAVDQQAVDRVPRVLRSCSTSEALQMLSLSTCEPPRDREGGAADPWRTDVEEFKVTVGEVDDEAYKTSGKGVGQRSAQSWPFWQVPKEADVAATDSKKPKPTGGHWLDDVLVAALG